MSVPRTLPGFEPCGRRVGDYQLGQMLGGGGMGAVYLARQISTNRLVSLKILRADLSSNPSYMKRFFHEVRLLAKIDNPGIVQAYEAGVDSGVAFLAMEYVKGSDLKTILAVQKQLPEQDVLQVASVIAKTMAYAWNRFHLVHRDIKPANIMRAYEDGAYRLLDLGISKLADGRSETTSLTSEQMVSGSPTYMSPEQADGTMPVDCRSDIYSLGITMYHLLAGEAPYASGNPVEVLMMHRTAPVPDLCHVRPDISRETAALVGNMMAKDPEKRPAQWEIVAHMADSIFVHSETVPRTRDFASPFIFPQNKLRVILFTLLCILLALLVLFVFFLPVGSENVRRIAHVFSPVSIRVDDELASIRTSELQTLFRLSADLESKGEFEAAANLWKSYSPPEELANDKMLKERIAEHLLYIEDRIKEEKASSVE